MGHGWFKSGSRTAVKKKLGFKNFYLYTAASPKTGEDFSLLAPSVDTDCMNIFLQHMSEWLGARKAYVVMDQAGWHKSKELLIPVNIELIYLPPYSPELNPVERLWQHIKDRVLKNRIFESLDTLEVALSDFIKAMSTSTIRSVCHVTYMPRYL